MRRGTLLAGKPPAPAAVEAPAQAAAAVPAPAARAKSRAGKRTLTAFVDPAAFRQLKQITVDEDLTMQELFLEGINAVFERRGLSRIA